MRLGIAIDSSYTRVAAYSQGRLWWEAADWPGPIPSLAAYQPVSGRLSFGSEVLTDDRADCLLCSIHELAFTPNPQLPPGLHNPVDILTAFFKFLRSQLPDRLEAEVDSVTISIPNYLGIQARHRIIRALQQAFTVAETYLLPEPLSALLGYQTLHSQQGLDENILVINSSVGNCDVSFISAAGRGRQLVLEAQMQMGQDVSFTAFIETAIKPRGASLGLYGRQGWNLDYILLLGGGACDEGLLLDVETFFPGIPVCSGQIARPYAASGNCIWQASENHLYTIYPFKFYIEKNLPNGQGSQLEPIPFDTVNLELELTGRYRIASVPVEGDYNLGDSENLELRIYQLPGESPDVEAECIYRQIMSLHCRESQNGEDGLLDLEFHMPTSQLLVNFTTSPLTPPDMELWANWSAKQLSQANWLSLYKHIDQELIKALSNQLDANVNNSSQLMTTYYKILCVLQILNP